KRCGPEPLENAAFPVNRDDGDQRQYSAKRDEHRYEDRQTDAQEPGGRERARGEPASRKSTYEHKNQNRKQDRSECPERLTQEDLDLQPGQFPKSTQHCRVPFNRGSNGPSVSERRPPGWAE